MSVIPPSAIALLSIFFYNCVNAIFGYLTNVMAISMLQLVAFQSIPSLLGCVIYTIATDPPNGVLCPPGTRLAIWSIAVLSTFGSLLVLSTLHQLTLSEHVTVMCVLPFFTAFVARLWLDEFFTKTQAACCLTCMIGVMIITDPFRTRQIGPPHDNDDGILDSVSTKLIGIALSLLGVCLVAPQYVLMRLVGDRASTAQIKTITYFVASLSSPLFMLITRTPLVFPTNSIGWMLLGSLIIIGLMADVTIAYAAQRTSPTTVTICVYAGVVFSNIMQWLMYGNHPSPVAFAGMFIVLAAGLYGVVYGPAVDPNRCDANHLESETSRLLQEDQRPERDTGDEGIPDATFC